MLTLTVLWPGCDEQWGWTLHLRNSHLAMNTNHTEGTDASLEVTITRVVLLGAPYFVCLSHKSWHKWDVAYDYCIRESLFNMDTAR